MAHKRRVGFESSVWPFACGSWTQSTSIWNQFACVLVFLRGDPGMHAETRTHLVFDASFSSIQTHSIHRIKFNKSREATQRQPSAWTLPWESDDPERTMRNLVPCIRLSLPLNRPRIGNNLEVNTYYTAHTARAARSLLKFVTRWEDKWKR